ncbi:type II toxin-antitoxin system VapC family toxin [Alkanindiges illinoisensis]|uniref:type II toxin-antitoxin system VapC family toxin n=1 Tax=Alkanindiges illinoisensis TaxID=197183 RepID=UPI00047B1E41|nr:type II toxin-antitoxin system VapC family toxin [Alkanindiges illinoisensis]
MYLYDTNIVSELTRKNPDVGVMTWIQAAQNNNDACYLSVITLGEIQQGIAKLQRRNDHIQAARFQRWYEQDLMSLAQYTLDFDRNCAEVWGRLMALNPHHPVDNQIAATALIYDLTLVTRNIKDIERTGVKFINPFLL